MLDFKKEVKKILIDNDMRLADLANKLGITRQKLNYDINSKSFEKKKEILNCLGYDFDVKIIKSN